jgi:hypothetical protein
MGDRVASARVAFDILTEIMAERMRQDQSWGTARERGYSDGTGRPGDVGLAAWAKAVCKANDLAHDNWRDILAEEVFEAFELTDTSLLRVELIQVAAVAVAWIEALDAREAQ